MNGAPVPVERGATELRLDDFVVTAAMGFETGASYEFSVEAAPEEGNPLAFQPRFLSLWYPKDWVWGGMRQDIFSVGRPAGLKEYREKVLSVEDLERSRSVVVTAIERIKGGHFEPAPRELPGTCVTRFGSCPHAAVCPYGGARPE